MSSARTDSAHKPGKLFEHCRHLSGRNVHVLWGEKLHKLFISIAYVMNKCLAPGLIKSRLNPFRRCEDGLERAGPDDPALEQLARTEHVVADRGYKELAQA